MPGVIRPYTLVDILSTINQNTQTGSSITGASATTFGVVAEADESILGTSIADAGTASAAAPAGWDQGVWGATSWQ